MSGRADLHERKMKLKKKRLWGNNKCTKVEKKHKHDWPRLTTRHVNAVGN